MSEKSRKTSTLPIQGRSGTKNANKSSTQIPLIERVATLKDLRKATRHTQHELAGAIGMRQGTISRIEKRDDMLVSTLRHYVAGVGGTLRIVATFPDRPPVLVERLGKKHQQSVSARRLTLKEPEVSR
jgi:transcriptional regulator with XRE-family HTH domain